MRSIAHKILIVFVLISVVAMIKWHFPGWLIFVLGWAIVAIGITALAKIR